MNFKNNIFLYFIIVIFIMDVSFCNTGIQRKVYKCIIYNTCYIFVGNDPLINGLIRGIKKNISDHEDDLLKNITEDIKIKYTGDQIEDKDTFIKKELLLESEYTIKFIQNDLIRYDDSIEMVLNKIAIYCSGEEINYPYIYAWFYNSQDEKRPLGFNYLDETIDYSSMDDIIFQKKSFCDLIDEHFIIEGEKNNIPYDKTLLKLLNTCEIKNYTIYFITLKKFLEKIEEGWTDEIQAEEKEVEECGELKSFVNGGIRKYWPYVNLLNVFNYPELSEKRTKDFKKIKELLNYYYLGIRTIETNFLKNKIDCGGFSINILKIISENKEINNINIQKIFSEFSLEDYSYKTYNIQYLFMKLILTPYTESFFKINTDCLSIYKGDLKKKHLEKWIKGDIRVNTYGYNYLQNQNSLLFKIYDKDIQKYITLIINEDGNIECVINEEDINEVHMKQLISHCKQTIDFFINKHKIYSYTRKDINTEIFNEDYYLENINFMDCQINFSKEFFQDKQSKLAKDWNRELIIFMENFPMYTRIKLEEITDIQRIKSRYKRINNYGNISSIHSMITTYLNPLGPNLNDDEIIHKIIEIFGISEERAIMEFNACKTTMNMKKEQGKQTFTKVPIEPGCEIEIYEDNQKININLNDVKSLDEFKRIILFIKTMINMYHKRLINDEYIELFTNVNKTNLNYDEMSFTSEKSSEKSTGSDSSSGSLLFSDSDDDDDSGSDIDFEGGAGRVVKSYYLNRLKEYDRELFDFNSNILQKSGQEYGYAKYCTESPSLGSRQPIAVSKKELERINKSEEEGSGRKSYSNIKTVDERENIHPDGGPVYICPLYWDIEKNLSIRPDYIKQQGIQIIDPKHGKKKVIETVLKRQGVNWKKGAEDFDNVDYIITDIKDRSKRLHPEGYGLPCCFSSNKTMKKIVTKDDKQSEDSEEREKKLKLLEKAAIKKGDSISTQTPAEPNEYSHIHPLLKIFFGQSKLHFKKKETNLLFNYKNYEPNLNNIQASGFLKLGVPHVDDGNFFKDSSFLESYIRCIHIDNTCKMKEKKFIDVNEFIDVLYTYFKKNNKQLFKQLFKQCSEIIHSFKKNIDDLSYDEMIDNTYENFFEWLKSDENRDETYLIPLLKKYCPEHLKKPPSIVIFFNHEKSEKILMNIHSNTNDITNNQYIFLYRSTITKNDIKIHYYEPLFYRKYSNRLEKHIEISLFPIVDEDGITTRLNHIIEYIQSVDYNQFSLIQIFVNIFDKLKDTIDTFYVDNQSKISYIITKNKYLLPIPPQPIPNGRLEDRQGNLINYKIVNKLPQSVKTFQENELYIKKLNETIKKLILFNSKKIKDETKPSLKIQETIKKLTTEIDQLYKKPILKRDEGSHSLKLKKTYSELFSNKQILLKHKQKIHHFGHLLKIYKQLNYFIIQNVIVSETNIINLILKNNSYIPIKKETYKRQYPIQLGIENLDLIDSNIHKDIDDERSEYITYNKQKEKLFTDVYNYLIVMITNDKDICDMIFSIKNGIKINEDKRKDFEILTTPMVNEIYKKETNIRKDIETLTKYEKNIKDILLWKFIDYLLIYEYYQLYQIINEKVNIHDFKKSVKGVLNCIYFTYYDYLNSGILNELFIRKSKYITSQKLTNKKEEYQKKKILYKLDALPYFIPKIFGNKSNVVYNLYERNCELITFLNAINEDNEIFIKEEVIREILIKHIDQSDEKNIKELYNQYHLKRYKNKQAIIDDILDINYSLQLPDFEYLAEYFKVCIIIISQKYNKKKNNEVFFYTYSGWENDISTMNTNIISFHHTLLNNEYSLSNIVKESKYRILFVKLYENKYFKKMIDSIIDIDIDEYIH